MIVTTTPVIEGHKIVAYHGIVSGEAIMGANIVRDLFAAVRDVVGGRSAAYEEKLKDARETALDEMEQDAAARGGNAVIGVDLDYEVVGERGAMLMVSATGTAVTIEPAG
jgi:uncharacterized protein YbjQ (UPF0145 family)